MKTMVIGAGGHARIVSEILQSDPNVSVVAFVDNKEPDSEEEIMGVPVVGDHAVIEDLVANGVEGFIIAVGDNEIRSRYFEKLTDEGLIPVNAVHPNAHVAPSAEIGDGAVIQSSAEVTTNAEIGDNVIINTGTIIEHENVVGDNSHVGPGSTVAGRVTIGSGVFVGMGCAIKEYTEIGSNATVGAGSVVLDDVPPGTLVAGSPAEIKRETEPGE